MVKRSFEQMCYYIPLFNPDDEDIRAIAKKLKTNYYECTSCKEVKHESMFGRRSARAKGVTSTCKECINIKRTLYRQTLTGALKRLLFEARESARDRLKRGRKQAGQFSLDFYDLLERYNYQEGCCYYFPSCKMSLIPNSVCHMSLERLNRYKGYHKENIVLCCEEFNGPKSNWSKDKVLLLRSLHSGQLVEPLFNTEQFLIDCQKPPPRKRGPKCKNSLHERNSQGGCVQCISVYIREQKEKTYHFLDEIYRWAKSNSHRRSQNKHRKNEDHTLRITIDDIIQMVIKQQGKCTISGKQMIFKGRSDWQCSIERKDNTKGYTKENTTLICSEFQTRRQWKKEFYTAWMNGVESYINLNRLKKERRQKEKVHNIHNLQNI